MNKEKFEEKKLEEYKLAELKVICKELGLAVSGKKEILYNRIHDSFGKKVKKTKNNNNKEIVLSDDLNEMWKKFWYSMIDAGVDPVGYRSYISECVKTP